MNEAQRQSYLRALGLTPWVARTTLPGAAPSEMLDWADETDAVESRAMPAVEATPVTTAPGVGDTKQTPNDASTDDLSVDGAAAAGAAAARPATATREATPTPYGAPGEGALGKALEGGKRETAAEPPAPATGAGLTFTLEAHLAGDTWVVFQQDDPQAPGLGRHTGALAASLLAVFGATPARPRRFYCPLTNQPMSAAEASQALNAFFAGLIRQQGGRQILVCADQPLARAVLGGERHQAVRLGDVPALAVDSLEEMLADPALAKKRSWRAMVEHGFAGPRG